MKMHCDIIQDLLPNYLDKICSDETNKAVEEHFVDCDSCRNKYQAMSNQWMEEVAKEEPKDKEVHKKDVLFKKIIKKVKRRLIITVLAIVLILIPIVSMGVNQKRGDGISFTSFIPVIKARILISDLKNGKYEEALKYVDFEADYKWYVDKANLLTVEDEIKELGIPMDSDVKWFDLIETQNGNYYLDRTMRYRIPQETFESEYAGMTKKSEEEFAQWYEPFQTVTYEEYKEYGKEYFVNNMQAWEKDGNKITGFKFANVYMFENKYQIEYNVTISNGKEIDKMGGITLFVRDGKITFGGGSHKVKEDETEDYPLYDELLKHLRIGMLYEKIN